MDPVLWSSPECFSRLGTSRRLLRRHQRGAVVVRHAWTTAHHHTGQNGFGRNRTGLDRERVEADLSRYRQAAG